MARSTDTQTMQASAATPFSLSPESKLGKVGLIVSNLQRSLDFYSKIIGLEVLSRDDRFAQLGTRAEGRILLELDQQDGVRPLTSKRLGLYHSALLLPSRADLSSIAEHLGSLGIRAGMSDHRVSEAFYLDDPDGLQIEVYADRDTNDWLREGDELAVSIEPLNLRSLLNEPHRAWMGVPSGSIVGHIHLYIGDVLQAERLYRHGLGMNVRTRALPGALFVAAGAYHHHIGLNTWAGNVPAASCKESRLSSWHLDVPTADLAELRDSLLANGWKTQDRKVFEDPWGIALRVV